MSLRKRHATAVALGALAAGALILPGQALAGGPTTFTVNDNAAGVGPAGADCADADFSSIQDAVDASSTGGTILVCAGQYPESVQVNKNLTLSGAQAGVDARTRSGAAHESVITADEANEGGVNLGANGITVDGFVIADAADPAIGAGIGMPATFGNQTVTNNVVSDNTIGISANNLAGSPSTISKNKFESNNVAGAAAGNAIYGDSNIDDLTISQNSFSDQQNASILFAAVDTSTVKNTNVSITGNTFTGDKGNPSHNELRILLLATQGTISGNTFENMNNNAIQLADGNNGIEISDNTIEDSGFAAVRVTDFGAAGTNSNITVTGNTLTGGDSAINVAPDGLSGALTASGNRIVGNTTGILLNDTDATINALNNWWGCNAGPGSPGCDSVGGSDAGDVTSASPLQLAIDAPSKIKKGKTKTITATIEGDAPSCEFPDDTAIGFATERGILSGASALTQDCVATTSLTAKGAKGPNVVSATLDNETVTDTVEFKKKKKK